MDFISVISDSEKNTPKEKGQKNYYVCLSYLIREENITICKELPLKKKAISGEIHIASFNNLLGLI